MDIAISDAGAPLTTSRSITVAVDPVALVVTECITITSAMRKHARWAHSSVSAILGGSVPSSRLEGIQSSHTSRKMSLSKRENGVHQSSDPSVHNEDVGLASRWGLRGKKGQSMQDNPLLSAFARLRSDLKQCKDIHTVDGPAILHPFLQIIRSSSTSAPITSLALIAITKFFAYGIISHKSPQLPLAMQLLASAVTNCRFEAGDATTDEIVLFRILKLMEGMITGPGGDVLGDESMCAMMETGISMCCQVKLSELLRRSAEVSMVTMCQTVFQRLKLLEVELEEPTQRRTSSKAEADAVKMDPTIDGDMLSSPTKDRQLPVRDSEDNRESSEQKNDTLVDADSRRSGPSLDQATGASSVAESEVSHNDLSQHLEAEESVEIKPYALPSIRELFRVLVGLLDPHDRQHNDTMRVMALRIVDVALEVAGPSIANHPSLALLAKDTLCRHLFQLVRSENIVILNESLRVAGTLLSTCRRVLKLQQELFLSYLVACLHPRVEIPLEPGVDPALYEGVPQAPRLVRAKPTATAPSDGRATPVPIKDRQKLGLEGGTRKPDAREAMVESVGALVRLPTFMAELFVNYDCEIDRSDLCLDMVGLLSRNAFPDAATWSTTNVPPLCLDALLGYVHSIAERLDDEIAVKDYPTLEQLRSQRALKNIIIEGASKFNENPKAGLAFLASQGVIKNVDDPHQLAAFLRGTSRVDKKVMGDFISKRGHEELLTAFIATIDFQGIRIDEALRKLLNSFRLPGEAPLIARIVTEFAKQYFFKSETQDAVEQDAVFVLTYAVIMLNTDQHNPNIKKDRMTYLDFAKNLRGVNGGKDFDPEYLQEIYDSIKTREIILPEEHDNRNSFDHAWKELQFKIQSTTDLAICKTNLFDKDMFAATWKPIVATLSYVFMSATDDAVFSRVVTGFDQCAQIATRYGLHEALDHIIFCLSSISSLATASLPSTALNTEVQAGEKSVMVSETAVRFGRDFKAQLATVVLFRVVVGNESAVREGWTHLVRIVLNLFVNSLLEGPYATISANSDLPPIPLQSPAQVIDRDRNESGLFSAFTSYVSSFANDEPPEPSDQEIEYTLCTVDCVSACSFVNFFTNISRLPVESLQAFVAALLDHLPEDTTPQVIVVKPEMPAPKPVRPNGQKTKQVGLTYDPCIVFVLELATILAARDPSTMSLFGQRLSAVLHGVVRDASHTHAVTLSRAVYYLLSFLRASHEHDFVRAPVVLHTISKFDQELLNQSGPYVAKGISLCLNGAQGLRNEMINSPDFWSVLQSLQSAPETAADVFDVVQILLKDSPSTLTADNFDPIVSLLNEFAASGSVGAINEQKRDQAALRGKQLAKDITPDETVDRGIKAIQAVYQMTSRVPYLVQRSHLEPQEAWTTYWPPVLRTLTTHSLNPCRQIRGQSLSCLQRVLLSDALSITSGEPKPLDFSKAISLFTDVIFPLIAQLLKPEVWQSDSVGMGETRLQVAVMCCKVFVRYLETLFDTGPVPTGATSSSPISPSSNLDATAFPLGTSEASSIAETPNAAIPIHARNGSDGGATIDGIRLWSHVLQVLERLIKAGGQHDGLDEAIPESLKNIVLVMASDGYLVPPASNEGEERTAQQKRLWKVTFVRLERFQPGLMEAIFPGAGRESPKTQSPAPSTARPAMSDAERVVPPSESQRKSSEETVIVEKQEA